MKRSKFSEARALLDDTLAALYRVLTPAGLALIQIDRPRLSRNLGSIHLGLATGRLDFVSPASADAILDEFEDAITAECKRTMMLEATIVMTRPD